MLKVKNVFMEMQIHNSDGEITEDYMSTCPHSHKNFTKTFAHYIHLFNTFNFQYSKLWTKDDWGRETILHCHGVKSEVYEDDKNWN